MERKVERGYEWRTCGGEACHGQGKWGPGDEPSQRRQCDRAPVTRGKAAPYVVVHLVPAPAGKANQPGSHLQEEWTESQRRARAASDWRSRPSCPFPCRQATHPADKACGDIGELGGGLGRPQYCWAKARCQLLLVHLGDARVPREAGGGGGREMRGAAGSDESIGEAQRPSSRGIVHKN